MKKFKEVAKDITLRTAKTFCETLVGFVGVGAMIQNVDWKTALSVSAASALVTVLVNVVVNINKVLKEVEHDEEL